MTRPTGQRDAGCFEGNYGSYIDDLKKRKGPDADQPHRIKYKPLTRA
jgi:energy-dependent translational throttle protein EttA